MACYQEFSQLYPTLCEQLVDSHCEYVEVTTLGSSQAEYVVSYIDYDSIENEIQVMCDMYSHKQLRNQELMATLKTKGNTQ